MQSVCIRFGRPRCLQSGNPKSQESLSNCSPVLKTFSTAISYKHISSRLLEDHRINLLSPPIRVCTLRDTTLLLLLLLRTSRLIPPEDPTFFYLESRKQKLRRKKDRRLARLGDGFWAGDREGAPRFPDAGGKRLGIGGLGGQGGSGGPDPKTPNMKHHE